LLSTIFFCISSAFVKYSLAFLKFPFATAP